MRIYLAGPLFTTAEREFNGALAALLRAAEHEVFLPQEQEQRETTSRTIFQSDVAGIEWCEGVVANMARCCRRLSLDDHGGSEAWRSGATRVAELMPDGRSLSPRLVDPCGSRSHASQVRAASSYAGRARRRASGRNRPALDDRHTVMNVGD